MEESLLEVVESLEQVIINQQELLSYLQRVMQVAWFAVKMVLLVLTAVFIVKMFKRMLWAR